jgi:bacterioferritin-associated ferredoxin
MVPNDEVCLCFGVTKRKIVNFCVRERPQVASLISECLSAGTGCGWCVPFLRSLHRQVQDGADAPDLPLSPADYAKRRAEFHITKVRRGVDDNGNAT